MLTLSINGASFEVDVDPAMPLLWVLRDVLKMSDTKFGCGQGLCGACTVHLNGLAARSCIMPVSSASGKEITTISGLSEKGGHALQQSWKIHNVPQCGYCQPGQLMSAASLLNANKSPSDQDIDQAMSGNICRCGTYPRIKAAIKSAAKSINIESVQSTGSKS